MPDYPSNFFSGPFCKDGDKTIIPDSTYIKGRATIAEGFPSVTAQPVAEGGIAPNRLDFNGILYMLSAFAYWQQSGGQWKYDPTFEYTPPALVFHAGQFWACVKASSADSPVTPGTDTDYWRTLTEYIFTTNDFGITLTGDVTGSGSVQDGQMSIKTTANQAAKWTAPASITLSGDASGTTSIDGTKNVTMDVTNAQAAKWTTARTVSLTGDATGSAAIDGSKDASISVSGVQATKWKNARTLTLSNNASGSVSLDGSKNVTLSVTNSKAAQWTTARTLSLTGAVSGSVSIDGSANKSMTTTLNGSYNMVPNWNGWLFSNDVGYTASSNGYITVEWMLNETYHCGRCSCTIEGITYGWFNSAYGSGSCGFQCCSTVPVKKGNYYRVSGASYARFIPAS